VQGAAVDVATVLLKGPRRHAGLQRQPVDGDIAQVLSFVRSSWGNKAGAVPDSRGRRPARALQAARPAPDACPTNIDPFETRTAP
jgi:hypothetical protein